MRFTDEHVKRYLELHGDVPFYVALLHRLEAAEKCVELCSTDENCCAIPEFGPKGNVPDAILWLEVWRKAAGK